MNEFKLKVFIKKLEDILKSKENYHPASVYMEMGISSYTYFKYLKEAKDSGYIVRFGNKLIVTDEGKELIK